MPTMVDNTKKRGARATSNKPPAPRASKGSSKAGKAVGVDKTQSGVADTGADTGDASEWELVPAKESRVHLRGFATMALRDPERQKALASKGGHNVHELYGTHNRAQNARKAFIEGLGSDEERSAYFSSIATRSAASRKARIALERRQLAAYREALSTIAALGDQRHTASSSRAALAQVIEAARTALQVV